MTQLARDAEGSRPDGRKPLRHAARADGPDRPHRRGPGPDVRPAVRAGSCRSAAQDQRRLRHPRALLDAGRSRRHRTASSAPAARGRLTLRVTNADFRPRSFEVVAAGADAGRVGIAPASFTLGPKERRTVEATFDAKLDDGRGLRRVRGAGLGLRLPQPLPALDRRCRPPRPRLLPRGRGAATSRTTSITGTTTSTASGQCFGPQTRPPAARRLRHGQRAAQDDCGRGGAV